MSFKYINRSPENLWVQQKRLKERSRRIYAIGNSKAALQALLLHSKILPENNWKKPVALNKFAIFFRT